MCGLIRQGAAVHQTLIITACIWLHLCVLKNLRFFLSDSGNNFEEIKRDLKIVAMYGMQTDLIVNDV